MLHRLATILFRPIDSAWLVAFRIGAGWLLALEHGGAIVLGRVHNYTEPRFHFRYIGWEWLPHPPPTGIYAIYALIVVAGLAVAAGWHYRLMAPLLSAGYVALLLLEETEYINHFYLYALVAAVLAVLPAHHAASADARAGRVEPHSAVPAWTRLLLLFQVGLVYLFAALAKLNADWLAARPLTVWLGAKAHYPLLGSLLAAPATAWLLSYGGIVFDALVVPLLLWHRTRAWSFVVAVLFHLTNVVVFGLGTFPWFSILLTSLFFSPGFPRHLPGVVGRWFRERVPPTPPVLPLVRVPLPYYWRTIVTGLALFATVQLLLPLRHFLYPADTHWTEEGHRFSWHLMLRTKSGTALFRVQLPNGQVDVVRPEAYLTHNQLSKLTDSPDLLLQFAHLLARDYQQRGFAPTAVFCESWVSMNGLPARPLISPTLNLLTVQRGLGHYQWVLPRP